MRPSASEPAGASPPPGSLTTPALVDLPRYTRFALHLAAAPTPAQAAAAAARRDAPDDWSGAAAYAPTPDGQALDYADPDAVAAILALQPAGWQEDDDSRTLVFWLADGAVADATVAEALERLGACGRLEARREPPGWETAWQRFHEPHVIGRLCVRPPWYAPRDDLLDVVVEAGLAFGTGGHATTRQCLELLQTVAPRSLLDLGCGSGVVALAALRLGFAPVTGVDIDPIAVEAAAGNAALNGLEASFLAGDATDPAYPLPRADVVVANIALRPILRLAERWREGAAGLPADLLLSGLLVEQADEALAAFPAFSETARTDDGEWLTLHLSRRT